MSRRQLRGMTMVELMIALGITATVVAMTASLVVGGAYVTRKGEETADNNDASRYAGDILANALQIGGMGAREGLYVAPGGVMRRVSPIIGVDNASAPDELWVVVPSRNAMREACVEPGAAGTVQSVTGNLTLRCQNTLPQGTNTVLMGTNMVSGALLSNPVIAANVITSYTESGVSRYSDTPERGWTKGDYVMPVTIQHYYVASLDGGVPGDYTAPTALWMEQGKVSGNTTTGSLPFAANSALQKRVIQTNIEDLQLVWGRTQSSCAATAMSTWSSAWTGSAVKNRAGTLCGVDFAVWSNTWIDWNSPTEAPPAEMLVSVRVNVVSKSRRLITDQSGKKSTGPLYAPVTVEEHAPTPNNDGYSRNVYMRRVELPNLAPGNL